MVLTTRAVEAVTVHSEVYNKKSNEVLEAIAADKLVGLLRQIGQISDFAADIFSNLFKDAGGTYKRIGIIAQRIGTLEGQLPSIQSIFENNNPAFFYSALAGSNFIREPRPHEQLFTLDNMPEPIARVRASAHPPPEVAALDDFAKKNCLASYSDPDLFFKEWLNEENARLAKLQEENKARKAGKKKKKKAEPKTQKQVAAVQIKSYSAQGKEFEAAPAVSNNISNNDTNAVTTGGDVPEPPGGEDEETGSLASFSSALATSAPKAYSPPVQQQYQAPTQETSSIPIPEAPAFGDMMQAPPIPPIAPVFNENDYNTPVPVMNIPIAPIYNAPEAPPLAPNWNAPTAPPLAANWNAPEAPPLTAGAPSPTNVSSNARGGVLSQIAAGVQLRKAGPAAAKPVDARGGLLGEIKNRSFKLKAVNKEEEKKKDNMDKGGLSSIMAVLARRQAIAAESDDEGEGEEEEWS
jgi:hypothetical protein